MKRLYQIWPIVEDRYFLFIKTPHSIFKTVPLRTILLTGMEGLLIFTTLQDRLCLHKAISPLIQQ
jgi:hypothetical protein